MSTAIDTENGGMIVKRVSVPVGLEELMEGLSKEVLQKKPRDIYLFASEYFTRLLLLREKGAYKAQPIRSMQSVTKTSKPNLDRIICKGVKALPLPSKNSPKKPTPAGQRVGKYCRFGEEKTTPRKADNEKNRERSLSNTRERSVSNSREKSRLDDQKKAKIVRKSSSNSSDSKQGKGKKESPRELKKTKLEKEKTRMLSLEEEKAAKDSKLAVITPKIIQTVATPLPEELTSPLTVPQESDSTSKNAIIEESVLVLEKENDKNKKQKYEDTKIDNAEEKAVLEGNDSNIRAVKKIKEKAVDVDATEKLNQKNSPQDHTSSETSKIEDTKVNAIKQNKILDDVSILSDNIAEDGQKIKEHDINKAAENIEAKLKTNTNESNHPGADFSDHKNEEKTQNDNIIVDISTKTSEIIKNKEGTKPEEKNLGKEIANKVVDSVIAKAGSVVVEKVTKATDKTALAVAPVENKDEKLLDKREIEIEEKVDKLKTQERKEESTIENLETTAKDQAQPDKNEEHEDTPKTSTFIPPTVDASKNTFEDKDDKIEHTKLDTNTEQPKKEISQTLDTNKSTTDNKVLEEISSEAKDIATSIDQINKPEIELINNSVESSKGNEVAKIIRVTPEITEEKYKDLLIVGDKVDEDNLDSNKVQTSVANGSNKLLSSEDSTIRKELSRKVIKETSFISEKMNQRNAETEETKVTTEKLPTKIETEKDRGKENGVTSAEATLEKTLNNEDEKGKDSIVSNAKNFDVPEEIHSNREKPDSNSAESNGFENGKENKKLGVEDSPVEEPSAETTAKNSTNDDKTQNKFALEETKTVSQEVANLKEHKIDDNKTPAEDTKPETLTNNKDIKTTLLELEEDKVKVENATSREKRSLETTPEVSRNETEDGDGLDIESKLKAHDEIKTVSEDTANIKKYTEDSVLETVKNPEEKVTETKDNLVQEENLLSVKSNDDEIQDSSHSASLNKQIEKVKSLENAKTEAILVKKDVAKTNSESEKASEADEEVTMQKGEIDETLKQNINSFLDVEKNNIFRDGVTILLTEENNKTKNPQEKNYDNMKSKIEDETSQKETEIDEKTELHSKLESKIQAVTESAINVNNKNQEMKTMVDSISKNDELKNLQKISESESKIEREINEIEKEVPQNMSDVEPKNEAENLTNTTNEEKEASTAKEGNLTGKNDVLTKPEIDLKIQEEQASTDDSDSKEHLVSQNDEEKEDNINKLAIKTQSTAKDNEIKEEKSLIAPTTNSENQNVRKIEETIIKTESIQNDTENKPKGTEQEKPEVKNMPDENKKDEQENLEINSEFKEEKLEKLENEIITANGADVQKDIVEDKTKTGKAEDHSVKIEDGAENRIEINQTITEDVKEENTFSKDKKDETDVNTSTTVQQQIKTVIEENQNLDNKMPKENASEEQKKISENSKVTTEESNSVNNKEIIEETPQIISTIKKEDDIEKSKSKIEDIDDNSKISDENNLIKKLNNEEVDNSSKTEVNQVEKGNNKEENLKDINQPSDNSKPLVVDYIMKQNITNFLQSEKTNTFTPINEKPSSVSNGKKPTSKNTETADKIGKKPAEPKPKLSNKKTRSLSQDNLQVLEIAKEKTKKADGKEIRRIKSVDGISKANKSRIPTAKTRQVERKNSLNMDNQDNKNSQGNLSPAEIKAGKKRSIAVEEEPLTAKTITKTTAPPFSVDSQKKEESTVITQDSKDKLDDVTKNKTENDDGVKIIKEEPGRKTVTKSVSSDVIEEKPVHDIKRQSSFDLKKLRKELKSAEEKAKLAAYKSSYNPFILREEIKKAASNNNTKSSPKRNILSETVAALKIQSIWRGFTVRKNQQVKKKTNKEELDKFAKAALSIQKLWRGFKVRKIKKQHGIFGDSIENKNEKIEEIKSPQHKSAAMKIQALWRGYQVRKNIGSVKSKLDKLENVEEKPKYTRQNLTDGDILDAATKIQAGVRGYLQRKKNKDKVRNLGSINEEETKLQNGVREELKDKLNEEETEELKKDKDKLRDLGSMNEVETVKLQENKVIEELKKLDKVEIPMDSPQPKLEKTHTVEEEEIKKECFLPLVDETKNGPKDNNNNESNFSEKSKIMSPLEVEVKDAVKNISEQISRKDENVEKNSFDLNDLRKEINEASTKKKENNQSNLTNRISNTSKKNDPDSVNDVYENAPTRPVTSDVTHTSSSENNQTPQLSQTELIDHATGENRNKIDAVKSNGLTKNNLNGDKITKQNHDELVLEQLKRDVEESERMLKEKETKQEEHEESANSDQRLVFMKSTDSAATVISNDEENEDTSTKPAEFSIDQLKREIEQAKAKNPPATPNKQPSERNKNSAATKIQSAFRGYRVRRDIKSYMVNPSSVKIPFRKLSDIKEEQSELKSSMDEEPAGVGQENIRNCEDVASYLGEEERRKASPQNIRILRTSELSESPVVIPLSQEKPAGEDQGVKAEKVVNSDLVQETTPSQSVQLNQDEPGQVFVIIQVLRQ